MELSINATSILKQINCTEQYENNNDNRNINVMQNTVIAIINIKIKYSNGSVVKKQAISLHFLEQCSTELNK